MAHGITKEFLKNDHFESSWLFSTNPLPFIWYELKRHLGTTFKNPKKAVSPRPLEKLKSFLENSAENNPTQKSQKK